MDNVLLFNEIVFSEASARLMLKRKQDESQTASKNATRALLNSPTQRSGFIYTTYVHLKHAVQNHGKCAITWSYKASMDFFALQVLLIESRCLIKYIKSPKFSYKHMTTVLAENQIP